MDVINYAKFYRNRFDGFHTVRVSNFGHSHRNETLPLTQDLNNSLACDKTLHYAEPALNHYYVNIILIMIMIMTDSPQSAGAGPTSQIITNTTKYDI